MIKRLPYLLAFFALYPLTSFADEYQIYFPDGSLYAEDGSIADDDAYVLIVNTSSAQAIQAPLSGYLNRTYTGFSNDWEVTIDAAGSNQIVQDLTGSTMRIKDTGFIQVNGVAEDAPGYTYDRLIEFNVSTGEVTSETIVATSQAAYDLMVEAGYSAVLIDNADAGSRSAIQFTSYAENVTNDTSGAQIVTNGGFSTNQIVAADGASLFRQEDDGTVHIGENSIVLADESVSASGNDEIYSTSDVLQLGNDGNHRTVIVGTLEVPDPTAPNHAASRRYVDGVGAMSLAASAIQQTSGGKNGIGLGLASLQGEMAFALGLAGDISDYARFSLTASRSSAVGSTGVAGGLFFAW